MYALVDRKLLSRAGPTATSCSLSPGLCQGVLGVAVAPSGVGHHQGGGGCTPGWARPSREGHRGVLLPGRPWERTKEFQGNSSVFQSALSSRHSRRRVAALPPRVSVHTLHAWCPTHRILSFTVTSPVPRALNVA